jgi:hypothetical protein
MQRFAASYIFGFLPHFEIHAFCQNSASRNTDFDGSNLVYEFSLKSGKNSFLIFQETFYGGVDGGSTQYVTYLRFCG